jgi:aspartyl-tRNA(Asn)/glutamyl-tRNA(Gln) amidotransferase subunit B
MGDVPKQTRGWDDEAQVTRGQRSKEESSDYRYFPEPDLLPVTVGEDQIAAIRQSLGELPAQLRTRLEATYGITPYDSDVLVNQGRPLVDYYIELAGLIGDGKLASNWMQQDVLRWLNERQKPVEGYPVWPGELARLIGIVRGGRLSTSRGREVLAEMIVSGRSPEETMQAMGIVEVDSSNLESLCRELLEANPRVIADIKEGKLKAIGALIGQAKKKNPNVDANRFREMCLEVVAGM